MTKLEEVARAICKAEDKHCHEMHPCDRSPCKCGFWPVYTDAAKAAIQAMREPTKEMLTAGYHAQSEATRYALIEAHQAMIDQVLSEGK